MSIIDDDNSINMGYESESESDVDSLTEDLDQIGKFNLNLPINLNLSLYINKESFNFSNLPSFELPKLQEFSKEFSLYLSNYISKNNEKGEEDKRRLINSIKTAISTRIQMNNFLNDLNLGLSITAAIDRLQPLKDIVHETILLPAEDTSDFEDDYDMKNEELTEPVGVAKIVNRDQPFINEIIKPGSGNRRHKRVILYEAEDSGTQTSDLDNIEGLTIDEVKALTHLDSLDDFYKEDLLRKKIQMVQGLKEINQQSKNKLVTRLMMGNYYKYVNEKLQKDNIELLPKLKKQQLVINEADGDTIIVEDELIPEEDEYQVEREEKVEEEEEKDESDSDEVMLTEQDQEPSFYDPPCNTILGCQHYQRNCKIECPTCLKWFPCRFCHDNQISTHKLVRSGVKHILCMKCKTPQVPDNNYCVQCGIELANYFCSICVLYDNDPTKDIYHCDKCGICRLGLGLGKDYFHCDECNICLSIDLKERHKCLSNTTHCNCPICNEYLFTSINKVVFMKCGHSIHQSCYEELNKHSYKCPICKKTVVNVETQFRILDQEINQSPLPSPYNLWRCIISCNDCKGKSNVPYHVLGLKCKYCKSYNSNQLKLIKPEEEEYDQEESDGDGDTKINQMCLIQTNLSSNFIIDEQNNNEDDYDGDNNSSDNEDEEMGEENGEQNIINLRRLTNSIINNLAPSNPNSSSTISYITSVLQNFINNAASTDPDKKMELSDVKATHTNDIIIQSDSEYELDNIGGF